MMPKKQQTQWPSATVAAIKDTNITPAKLELYKKASARIMRKYGIVDAELKNGGLCSKSCIEIYNEYKTTGKTTKLSCLSALDTVEEFQRIEKLR